MLLWHIQGRLYHNSLYINIASSLIHSSFLPSVWYAFLISVTYVYMAQTGEPLVIIPMRGAKLQFVNGVGLVSGVFSDLFWWKSHPYLQRLQILTHFLLYSPPPPLWVILSVLGRRGGGLYHGFLAPSIYEYQSFSQLNAPAIIEVALD
jgi:hypothetical protein